MHPRLITEPFTLPTYGVLLACAFLAALWLAHRQARRAGLDAERISDMAVWVIIAGLLGAKLLLVVVEWPAYLAQFQEVAARRSQGWGPALSQLGSVLFGILQSGGVFYGGLLGAVPAALYCVRRYSLPFWKTADALAPAVILGQAIGRWGCFFAGCCYGRETDVAWAVTFRDAYAMRQIGTRIDIPLHPVQVYESLLAFLILAVLLWMSSRKRFHGQILMSYLALYGIARFVLEYFRGDPRGSVFHGALSTSQFIAALALLAAALVTPYLIKTQRLASEGTPAAPAA